MIHIGMSNSDSGYALEELGHRDGYGMADVDGEKLPPGDAENGGIWERCPKELTTSLNVKNVCERLALCVPVSCDFQSFFAWLRSQRNILITA
jgi:hypothetical protein